MLPVLTPLEPSPLGHLLVIPTKMRQARLHLTDPLLHRLLIRPAYVLRDHLIQPVHERRQITAQTSRSCDTAADAVLAMMQNLIVRVRAELGDAYLRDVLVPADPVGPRGVDAERHPCEARPADGFGQARIA